MPFFRSRIPAVALVLTAGLFAPASALAQRGGAFPLTSYRLKNGLNVILSEDISLPIVSVAVAYGAGSVVEPAGKTGMASMMENLMFSGSANVPPRQHFNYINRVGGTFNAMVSEDRTVFYETVPSNRLSLLLWLESDRMRSLEIGAKALEDARSALLEDLQDRRATDPFFESSRKFDQLLYSDFAQSQSLLGTEEDVRGLTIEDLRAFYAANYGPNNAVLCITGSFDKLRARELVSQYFETLPRGRDAVLAVEPLALARKQVVQSFVEPTATAPAFYLGFRLPAPRSVDFYTLTLLDYILFRGRTSKIARRLLNPDAKIAYRLSGGIERRRDRAVYKIFVIANNDVMIQYCQTALFSELARLKSSPLSEDDLSRYKAMFKQDYLARLSTTVDRALYLDDYFLTLGGFQEFGLDLEKYMSVSAADVIGIVARYLTPENSIILDVRTK
jgi:predicted Zn-dependent peptidase